MTIVRPNVGDMVLVQSAAVPCDGIYMVGRLIAWCDHMGLVEFTTSHRSWFRTKPKTVRQWHTCYETIPGEIIGKVDSLEEIEQLERMMR